MQSKTNKFFICGFSGAGKSTLLRLLADKFPHFICIDLDDYILDQVQEKQLGDYINAVGIEGFRDHERNAIEELYLKDNLILALGGGTLSDATIPLLREFKGLWLNTSFEVCWQRIKYDNNRPLVRLGKESLSKLFHQRQRLFENYYSVGDHLQAVEFIMKNKES